MTKTAKTESGETVEILHNVSSMTVRDRSKPRRPLSIEENHRALCGEAEKGGAFRGYFPHR